MIRLLSLLFIFLAAGAAQPPRRGYIRAYGEGVVSVRPDQARVTVSVVTIATTAQESSTLNSTRATAVLDQLRAALASRGELRTLSYSLTPNYNYPRDGSPPQLTGFTATNTMEAMVNDLSITGNIIDTAIQAGASRVDGLRLTLKDDEPSRGQVLRTAGQKARARAEAIAQGLGVKLGAVLAAEEGISVRSPLLDRGGAPTVATPVEVGTLEVRGSITLDIEIVP